MAVGLDPADTVDEFCRLYLHGDRRARSTIREIASITATESGYRDEFGHDERRRSARREAAAAAVWYAPVAQVWRSMRSSMIALWARPAAHGQSGTTSRSL